MTAASAQIPMTSRSRISTWWPITTEMIRAIVGSSQYHPPVTAMIAPVQADPSSGEGVRHGVEHNSAHVGAISVAVPD